MLSILPGVAIPFISIASLSHFSSFHATENYTLGRGKSQRNRVLQSIRDSGLVRVVT
jgi:hypothetical protein